MKVRLPIDSILAVLWSILLVPPPAMKAQENEIEGFDRPFVFCYLSWEGKVATEKGVAVIRGVDNQGGAGINGKWDIAANAEMTPVLRIKIGPANQASAIVLLLGDSEQRQGRWTFPLPQQATSEFIEIFPKEGASFSEPNAVGDDGGKPDLENLRQVQLIGDWSGAKEVDVEVDAVLMQSPSEEVLNARAAKKARLLAEANQKKQQQESLKARFGKRSQTSPTVQHISMVANDVMAIEIQAGTLIPAEFSKYEPIAGDQKRETKNEQGEIKKVELLRDDQIVGWLIGPDRGWLTTYEQIAGDPLLDFVADKPETYRIKCGDDAESTPTLKPISVGRKSHVNAWAQGPSTVGVRHTLYLRLPKPLTEGKTYRVKFGTLNTRRSEIAFEFRSNKIRSEAVHAHQIGYRPDDPAKQAFLSCWLGTGGVLRLPESMRFSLVDEASGRIVFEGRSERHFPADQPELMARDANFNGTDVARCDFSRFSEPGRYRVVVDGVGCSFPFEIGDHVWQTAFLTQMRGLYHQRSGVELGPPYTDFRKPRDMHPADGYPVTQSKYRSVESGGESFASIVDGDTGEPRAGGWGGYHDAGDWNPRRVTHMKTTMATLEIFELFPDYFAALELNIPKTEGLPDILTEAMFEFQCFERLQQSNGGVGFGIESKGDPLVGEVSWLNGFSSYILAPDYASSWYYSAVAARLARLLKPYNAKRANVIRDSAIRAFQFAEQDYARDKTAGHTAKRDNTWQATDSRNLAALELYRLTGEPDYHDVFLKDSALTDQVPDLFVWGKHVQREQAFIYANLPDGLGEPERKQKAVEAIEVVAQRALQYAEGNAFNVTTCDRGKPQFIGHYTVPDAADLTRAHFLTGDPRYLAGAVRSTQFQSGCNPNNLVYMTGLSTNPVKNVFKLDARRTGQAVPAGLVPYGNIDFQKWHDNGVIWPITWVIGKATVPDAYAWPTHQAYWDLGGWPMLEEYTVDRWAPNVLVWGYLAAREKEMQQ
ncbi:Endoglucanase D precursor [Planctomycetes bacterium CA13]|uniref:Endoglucanase D n=1 Tax=Novipirellula herctigrandis TaxID=2527986 RepID=A0A5C5Z826_9BACT|nr:Endoglucanase D precursor [Planctomycetes bacterium CA13]